MDGTDPTSNRTIYRKLTSPLYFHFFRLILFYTVVSSLLRTTMRDVALAKKRGTANEALLTWPTVCQTNGPNIGACSVSLCLPPQSANWQTIYEVSMPITVSFYASLYSETLQFLWPEPPSPPACLITSLLHSFSFSERKACLRFSNCARFPVG